MSLPASRPALWPWVLMSGGAGLALALSPLLLGQSWFGLDLTRVDLPFQCELRAHLHVGGGFALSRLIGNGEPLFANPQAQALYPLRWLQVLLPQYVGLQAGIGLHLALAAAGTTWLAASFGIRGALAAWTGLFFMLSGTVLDLVGHCSYLLDAAWLGWAWGGARLVLAGRGGPAGVAALLIALAAFLLGGEPFGFGLALALVGLECALAPFARDRPAGSLRTAFLQVGGALASATAIGLGQWLSSWPELHLGAHGDGLSAGVLLHWPLEAPHLLGMALPGVLIAPVQGSDNLWTLFMTSWGLHGAAADGSWNLTPYLGLPCIALASLSLLRGRTRVAVAVLVLGALLAAGGNTPLFPALLAAFPPLRFFRYPAKYFVLCTLAVAVLAGATLQALTDDTAERRRAARALLGALLILLLLLAGLSLEGPALHRWAAALAATTDLQPGLPTVPALLSRLLTQETVLLGLFTMVLLLARKAEWALRLLPLLVAADLLLAALSSVTIGRDPFSGPAPLASSAPTAEAGPIYCASEDLFRALHPTQPSVHDYLQWDLALATKTFSLPNLNACDGVVSGIPYSILQPDVRKLLRDGVSRHRTSAARALGCTHLVSMQAPVDGQVRRPATNPFAGLQLPGAMAPAVFVIDDPVQASFVSKEPRWTTPREDLLSAVSQSRSALEVVRLVDDPEGHWPAGMPLPSGGAVESDPPMWEGATRAKVDLRGTGGAVVGLRTTYASGWQASQGGAPLPTLRVSASFVAAVTRDATLGPILFEYRIPNLRYGLLSAFAGLAGAVGLLLASTRRQRAG